LQYLVSPFGLFGECLGVTRVDYRARGTRTAKRCRAVSMHSQEMKREYFVLNGIRSELLRETSKPTVGSMTDFQHELPDPLDQACIESDSSLAFRLRLRERESKLIRKIKYSLDRLEQGTFGICDECGGQISEGRLRARPIATLCIKCKEEQERLEKVVGF
jgi:DnaK suppressor protein